MPERYCIETRLYAAALDFEPREVNTDDGSYDRLSGEFWDYEHAGWRQLSELLGADPESDDGDIADAITALRADRDRLAAELAVERASSLQASREYVEAARKLDRLQVEVERLQAGQGKPQRGRPIPPCHPRGDGCDVGSHYLTVRHPDGSMGWTVHISDREIQHLRWLTGPEELRSYSDVAQRSLGSAPGEWTVSPPQDASVSAPQIIRAVPVSDQPEPSTRPSTITDAYGNRWTP